MYQMRRFRETMREIYLLFMIVMFILIVLIRWTAIGESMRKGRGSLMKGRGGIRGKGQ